MGSHCIRLAFALLLGLAAAGASAQDQMVKSTRTEVAPEPGKALVIFVRSSIVVGAYSAPVIHVDVKYPDPKPGQPQGDDRVVGILPSYSKVAYQAEPGEHTFMATGWLDGNRPSVNQKKAEALQQWNKLPEEEKKKLTLLETDAK